MWLPGRLGKFDIHKKSDMVNSHIALWVNYRDQSGMQFIPYLSH